MKCWHCGTELIWGGDHDCEDDDLYDILITFNYNLDNIKKFKGSAIFLHCSDISKDRTDGCIAIKKEILLQLLDSIKIYSKLIIV